MPTKREREYYRMGFADGQKTMYQEQKSFGRSLEEAYQSDIRPKPKRRKLSAWNKYVKANANKPRFRYRDGKLNLKKMGVAFRKTPAGKKKRR